MTTRDLAKLALAEDLRRTARIYLSDLGEADIIDVLHDVVGDIGSAQETPVFIRSKRNDHT